MRIAVISDTHIPTHAGGIPNSLLETFKNFDMIIHAGDLVDLSVLYKLKTIGPDVKAVWGNMDSMDVRKNLPQKEIITAGKYKIGLTHGKGAPAYLLEYVSKTFANDRVDIIVFGHSHEPVNEKRGDILYFNPGSLTDTVFSNFNSFGIIEINDEIKSEIVKIQP